MKLEAEHVMIIIVALVFISVIVVLLALTFSGGATEISKNRTIIELTKIWS